MLNKRFTLFLFLLGISIPLFARSENPPIQENTNLFVRIGDREEIIPAETYSDWFSFSSNLFHVHTSKYISEIENTHRCNALEKTCLFNETLRQKKHTVYKKTVLLKAKKLQEYINNLAEKTRTEARRSRFSFSPETVSASLIEAGENGFELDREKAFEVLSKTTQTYFLSGKFSEDPITLPTTILPAQTDMDTASLGIHSLISEGKTNFTGSTRDRIFNIRHAMERFNGILIRPKEEFSFVSVLGPVDGEHGYKPELVIRNNKTEPEFGGGICQVSTTMFRAAIYSGLKVTERRNHSYPVRYYSPIGFDATVYVPKPDFRFINNTPGHILVQTEIVGTTLYFRFYGTDDGRKTTVNGPYVIERSEDGSMKTIFTQTVTDAQENIFIQDDFKSKYASPSKYPHPGDILTVKPDDWSKRQWQEYTNTHPTPNP